MSDDRGQMIKAEMYRIFSDFCFLTSVFCHLSSGIINKDWTKLNNHLTPIGLDEKFRFACSPEVACFNECCRDLNQFLYPYDILRLKKRLGLTSSEFLEHYTIQHIGPESGLPMVTLKTTDEQRRICPFVTPKGCQVYADRPASCRTYPLARALARNRETGRIEEHFMLLKEPHCLGFKAAESQTVQQWTDNQEIGIYNHFNDQMLDLIRLKNQLRPGLLNPKSRQLFCVALYDLDRFRTLVSADKILDQIEADPQKRADAETDDTALLEVAMEWVKQSLFKS